MKKYSRGFRERMLQRLCMPGGPSAHALAKEVGVHSSTLSRWRREAAHRVGGSNAGGRGVERKDNRRPQEWNGREKLQAVVEAEGLGEEKLGEFLRRRGLHQVHLRQWREEAVSGLEKARGSGGQSREVARHKRRIRELESELRRKEAALAETAALLVLKKKVHVLWGDEEGSTLSKSER